MGICCAETVVHGVADDGAAACDGEGLRLQFSTLRFHHPNAPRRHVRPGPRHRVRVTVDGLSDRRPCFALHSPVRTLANPNCGIMLHCQGRR